MREGGALTIFAGNNRNKRRIAVFLGLSLLLHVLVLSFIKGLGVAEYVGGAKSGVLDVSLEPIEKSPAAASEESDSKSESVVTPSAEKVSPPKKYLRHINRVEHAPVKQESLLVGHGAATLPSMGPGEVEGGGVLVMDPFTVGMSLRWQERPGASYFYNDGLSVGPELLTPWPTGEELATGQPRDAIARLGVVVGTDGSPVLVKRLCGSDDETFLAAAEDAAWHMMFEPAKDVHGDSAEAWMVVEMMALRGGPGNNPEDYQRRADFMRNACRSQMEERGPSAH